MTIVVVGGDGGGGDGGGDGGGGDGDGGLGDGGGGLGDGGGGEGEGEGGLGGGNGGGAGDGGGDGLCWQSFSHFFCFFSHFLSLSSLLQYVCGWASAPIAAEMRSMIISFMWALCVYLRAKASVERRGEAKLQLFAYVKLADLTGTTRRVGIWEELQGCVARLCCTPSLPCSTLLPSAQLDRV